MSEPMFEEAAAQALQVSRRDVRGCVVLGVIGEVDLSTAQVLGDAVTEALHQSGGRPVVVDLREVTFLGSSGLATLVQVTERAIALSEPLRLVVDENRPVVRPIEITGLDAVLALFHSLDDALSPAD